MDTEDSSVNYIRESSRNQLKLSRRFHRDEETDFRRHVQNYNITIEDIKTIAEKLKTKSSISVQELQTLKNGLLQVDGAVEMVLATAGALRGLVRELTGSDVNKSCVAAACCCNLSLDGVRAALRVGTAAGPYLVVAAHSLSDELALSSAWSLGNISASPAAADLLISQGAISALCELISRHGDVSDAALYGLLHIVYHADALSPDHLSKILLTLHGSDFTPLSTQLLFVLSCHEQFQISQNYLEKILDYFKLTIDKHLQKCVKRKSCCELVYLIRILANIRLVEDESSYNIIVSNILINISDNFKMLINSNMEKSLKDSLMWFLGNLYNFRKDGELFCKLIN